MEVVMLGVTAEHLAIIAATTLAMPVRINAETLRGALFFLLGVVNLLWVKIDRAKYPAKIQDEILLPKLTRRQFEKSHGRRSGACSMFED